jgi:hypothetical protein
MQVVDVDFSERRLEDVFAFVKQVSSADIDVLWADTTNPTGLNKDASITISKRPRTVLALIEEALDKAAGDGTSPTGNTWQMSEFGTLQCGPRERLNAFKRTEIYPVADLLLEIPDYPDAPRINIQQALQARGRGGGGGGQVPFTGNEGERPETRPVEERAQEVQDLITSNVEREQWSDNGGEGATIRFFQGSFLVNAPDYVHRGIAGYSWWPLGGQRVAMSDKGVRYVTLSGTTGASKLEGFERQPVTAVVPGQATPPTPPPNPCPNGDC